MSHGTLLLLSLAGLAGLAVAGGEPPVQLKVAAVQFRSTLDLADNCERMTVHLKQLAGRGVRVAVFPECALTGYRTEEAPPASGAEILTAEEQLGSVCRDNKIAAVFGSVYKINGRAYDTAVVINSRGERLERYGKMYLAGEKWATPGNHVSYFELEGVPSTVMICHDERYPELARLPAIAGARILYYISSESGLKREAKLKPYRAQIMARAVENDMFVVQANAPANDDLSGSHGQSRIIKTDGNIVQEASFFAEDVLVETLAVKPRKLTRPLEGALGEWWRQGVRILEENRDLPLD